MAKTQVYSEGTSPVNSLRRKKNPAERFRVKTHEFTAVFTPAEEGGFVVTCPALPGLVTQGDTLREARAMATEAIEGYLEVLIRDGDPIPSERKLRTETIGVRVPSFV